jgi:CRISPR/Cas system-associated exonuclease Cas4 (RecB family)
MNMGGWIHYLNQIISKKEICISRGLSGGIQLTNLSSADSTSLSHRIFLGLTESMVQNYRKSMISPDETNSISTDIGFDLLHPEVSTDEFDLEWLSLNNNCQDLYLYPQTGFSGSAEAPCALWLEKGGKEKLDIPEDLSWDYLKRSESYLGAGGKDRILQDLGLKKLSPLKLSQKISLSPSLIESYRKCAFIFTSQKFFRLMDIPILDLDLDRRTRGSLAHALLEKLTENPERKDYRGEEIRDILENLRQPLGLDSIDDFIWQGIREKHRAIGEKFLDFEKAWRKQFPETRTVAVEKKFEFQIENGWSIRGKIDRIDRDDLGNLVVIDYKGTPGDHKNFNNWLEKNQIQLALYMLAIESNAISDFSSQEVIGAFYYILKTMNRDKGLKLEEKAGTLFDLDRKKNRISLDKKTQLLKDVMIYVLETVDAIANGIIDPVPLDPKDCATCHWRSLCRAPHLN